MNGVHPTAWQGFTRSAAAYERARPDYPPAALDWLHVDLYAWNGKERPGRPVGAEPQTVRALYAFLKHRYLR